MVHPELNSDESVILATQNIIVKSVPYEVILTTSRLILVNPREKYSTPQDFPLDIIDQVEASENAIRDAVVTLTFIAGTTDSRQIALTFSRQAGGERKRERDEWVKILRERLASLPAKAAPEVFPKAQEELRHGIPIHHRTEPPVKKKIEISHPIKKVIETPAVPPQPVESSSLPSGSFCLKCGNRILADSAFCNRCGTKVIASVDQVAVPESPIYPIPAQTSSSQPADQKERPIEQVIHSIEPLIEGSKPRTEPAPLVPSRVVYTPPTEDAQHATHKGSIFSAFTQRKNLPPMPPLPATDEMLQSEQEPIATTTEEQAAVPVSPATSEASQVPQIVVPTFETPEKIPEVAVPVPPQPPAPVPVAPKSRKALFIGILVIIVLVILGGAFVMTQHGSAPAVVTTTPTTIPTTVPTPIPTPVPTPVVTTPTPIPTTPAPTIPDTGVWVEVTYPGSYTGSYGTPDYQQAVTDTGIHFYRISTVTGIAVASFTKNDGSSDEIALDLYKDGVLVKHIGTTAPKGTAELQYNLAPAPTATPTATATTAAPVNVTTISTSVTSNSTANATKSS